LYDLPVALHKGWLMASKDLPFLAATPSKVLMSVSGALSASLADTAKALTRALSLVTPGQLPLPLPPTPMTQSGVLVKAAKADDAEAEICLWDAELIENFPKLTRLTKEELGMMCKGLRNGAIRW
jgi:hypothetical protein